MSESGQESQLFSGEDLKSFFRIQKIFKETTNEDEDEGSEIVHQIKCEILNEEWQEEKDNLTKKIEVLEHDKSNMEEAFNKKSSEYDALQTELVKEEGERACLGQRIIDLIKEKEKLGRDWMKKEADWESKNNALKNQISEKCGQLSKLKSQVDSKFQEVSSLQELNDSLRSEKHQVEVRIEEVMNQNLVLERQIQKTNKNTSNTLKEIKTKHGLELEALNAVNQELSAQKSNLEKKLDEVKKNSSIQKSEIESLIKKLEDQDGKLDEWSQEIVRLNYCKAQADKESKAVKEKLQEVLDEKIDVENKLEEANKNSATHSSCFQLINENTCLKNENEEMKKEQSSDKEKIKELSEAARQKKKDHDEEMENLQKMLSVTSKNYYEIQTTVAQLKKDHDLEIIKLKRDHMRDKQKQLIILKAENEENEKKKEEKIQELSKALSAVHEEEELKEKEHNDQWLSHTEEIGKIKKEKAELQKKLSLASKLHRDTVASEANYRAKYIALRDEVNAPDTESVIDLTVPSRGICSGRGRGRDGKTIRVSQGDKENNNDEKKGGKKRKQGVEETVEETEEEDEEEVPLSKRGRPQRRCRGQNKRATK